LIGRLERADDGAVAWIDGACATVVVRTVCLRAERTVHARTS